MKKLHLDWLELAHVQKGRSGLAADLEMASRLGIFMGHLHVGPAWEAKDPLLSSQQKKLHLLQDQ